MNKDLKRISKLMSLILRHEPEFINVTLDEQGWLDVDTLIAGIRSKGYTIDKTILEEVVLTNDKQRFAFNKDHSRVRANQGHSINVDVELTSVVPPAVLFHGTVRKFLEAIWMDGLKKMSRLHVHLSANIGTASKVGGRRGKPVILQVDARQMHLDGFEFFKSENGVWLTDHVPPKYISLA